MRIGDLVNTTIAAAAISARPQRTNLALEALNGRGDGSGGERGIATPRVAAPEMESPEATESRGEEDSFELSDWGAVPQGEKGAAGEKPVASGNSSALSGLVEKFIRKRAIIAYSQPAKTPNGPTLDFVMEVEIAYRVIEPMEPGTTLDIQA